MTPMFSAIFLNILIPFVILSQSNYLIETEDKNKYILEIENGDENNKEALDSGDYVELATGKNWF